MNLNQIADGAISTTVGTAAIVNAPETIVDIETAKATLIALASTVIYKLVISAFSWLSKKISKKKDDDNDNNQALELSA